MTPLAQGGESPAERLDVMAQHVELLADDLKRLRADLERKA